MLQVTVTHLTTSRARSVNETGVRRLRYVVSGKMSLLDTNSGELLVDRKQVSGNSRLDFAERTLETPAVRDEGLNDAIAALADRIVQELLADF